MIMMRRILILALLVVLASNLVSAGPAKVPPPPDYFPLKVGYWWKFEWTANDKKSDFMMKVISEEKVNDTVLYLMESTTPTMVMHDWYSKPQGWVMMHKIEYPKNNMKADYQPIKKYLMNPPGTGATWDWSGTGMMSVDIKENNVVKGTEVVVVPAGKFTCQRVETDIVQGGQPVHKTYWFANWVGLVKSATDSNGIKSSTELVDYSFRPKH